MQDHGLPNGSRRRRRRRGRGVVPTHTAASHYGEFRCDRQNLPTWPYPHSPGTAVGQSAVCSLRSLSGDRRRATGDGRRATGELTPSSELDTLNSELHAPNSSSAPRHSTLRTTPHSPFPTPHWEGSGGSAQRHPASRPGAGPARDAVYSLRSAVCGRCQATGDGRTYSELRTSHSELVVSVNWWKSASSSGPRRSAAKAPSHAAAWTFRMSAQPSIARSLNCPVWSRPKSRSSTAS